MATGLEEIKKVIFFVDGTKSNISRDIVLFTHLVDQIYRINESLAEGQYLSTSAEADALVSRLVSLKDTFTPFHAQFRKGKVFGNIKAPGNKAAEHFRLHMEEITTGMDRESKIMKDTFERIISLPPTQRTVNKVSEEWKTYTAAVSKCLVHLNSYFTLRIDRHAYIAVELLDMCMFEFRSLGMERWIGALANQNSKAHKLVSALPTCIQNLRDWYGFEASALPGDQTELVHSCRSDVGLADLKSRILRLFYNSYQPISVSGKTRELARVGSAVLESLEIEINPSAFQQASAASSPTPVADVSDAEQSRIFIKLNEITQGMAKWSASIQKLLLSLDSKHHRTQIALLEQCMSSLIQQLWELASSGEVANTRHLLDGYTRFVSLLERLEHPSSEEILSKSVQSLSTIISRNCRIHNKFLLSLYAYIQSESKASHLSSAERSRLDAAKAGFSPIFEEYETSFIEFVNDTYPSRPEHLNKLFRELKELVGFSALGPQGDPMERAAWVRYSTRLEEMLRALHWDAKADVLLYSNMLESDVLMLHAALLYTPSVVEAVKKNIHVTKGILGMILVELHRSTLAPAKDSNFVAESEKLQSITVWLYDQWLYNWSKVATTEGASLVDLNSLNLQLGTLRRIAIGFDQPTLPDPDRAHTEKRFEIIVGLLKEESHYLSQLDTMLQLMMRGNSLKQHLRLDALELISSNTHALIMSLTELTENWTPATSVFDPFDRLQNAIPSAYGPYFAQNSPHLFKLEAEKNSSLMQFVKSSGFTTAQIEDQLGVPFIRLQKYCTIVKSVLQETPKTHSDYSRLRALIVSLTDVTTEVYTRPQVSGESRQTKIEDIRDVLLGLPNSFDLSKRCIYEGVITEKNHTRKLFLFSHSIVIAKPRPNSRQCTVHKVIPVGESTVIKTTLPGLPHCVGIVFEEKGKRRLRTFDTGSLANKQIWLQMFVELQHEYINSLPS